MEAPRPRRLSRVVGKKSRASANAVLDASRKRNLPPLPPSFPIGGISESPSRYSERRSSNHSDADVTYPKLTSKTYQVYFPTQVRHRRSASDLAQPLIRNTKTLDTWNETPSPEFIEMARKQIDKIKRRSIPSLPPPNLLGSSGAGSAAASDSERIEKPMNKFTIQHANRQDL